jgi:hypothetical protein
MNQLKLCIDPGVKAIAWALGYNGILKACGYYPLGPCLATAAKRAQEMVTQYLTTTGYETKPVMSYVLVERPMYEKDRAINHQDVIDLAIIAGACAAGWDNPVLVEPMKWKGSIPKETHQPRITGSLTHEESIVFSTSRSGKKEIDHNIIDAIGIFLWAERRLQR